MLDSMNFLKLIQNKIHKIKRDKLAIFQHVLGSIKKAGQSRLF